MILLIITIIFFILYSFLIIYYWQSWISIPYFIPASNPPIVKISVIIPARNEEDNIGRLLQALQQQTYPAAFFEVIVVDDHSTDATAKITNQFTNVRLVQLKEDNINSYKKKAIETGIAAATGDLIVTTDADCIPQAGWLQAIASFKEETNAIFIVAPVAISCDSSLLQIFQAMDFMVLQGITGAVVYKKQLSMCNGANLVYERKVFYEVNGFAGIDEIASGDDMLLMHKIAKLYPGRVHYLKTVEAIVSTQPMRSWKEFFNQRIRWGSKAAKYDDRRIFPVLLLVYLVNLCFFALFVSGFWNYQNWIYFLAGWMLKTLVEMPFFISMAWFFNKRWTIKFFFFFQPLHIFYTIMSGLLGQFGKYEWKGRRVK